MPYQLGIRTAFIVDSIDVRQLFSLKEINVARIAIIMSSHALTANGIMVANENDKKREFIPTLEWRVLIIWARNPVRHLV